MADPLPGQTREGLAILFFNAIVAKERPNAEYDRAYALDLLTEIMEAIDGKRPVTDRGGARLETSEPTVEPIPELEAELAAEAPVDAPKAKPARGGRAKPAVSRAVPAPPPARRGRSRKG